MKGQKPVFSQVKLPEEIHNLNALLILNNMVWLATDQGLYSYNGTEFHRYFEKDKPDLYQINSLAKDRSNTIWLGTYHGLLSKFKEGKIEQIYDIKSFCKSDNTLISSITIDTDQNNKNPEILLTTAGGEIFAVDTISKIIKSIKSPTEETIYSIKYGYSPTIWLCASDGFFTMNKNSKWKKKQGLTIGYGLFENEGKYWALGRDEEKKAILMLYYEGAGGILNRFKWNELNLSYLSDKYTRFYELDFTIGEIAWITSQSGLIRYNPTNASLVLYNKENGLELSELKHVAVQNNYLIWISSSGKKFYRIDLN